MEQLTAGQYSLVYNSISFTIAAMGAATIFFWLSRSSVAAPYRTAITLTGLVTAIACYHYFRIFQSWEASYVLENGVVGATGVPFNDAYRYVDWLLTVPLLLLELILVMRLSKADRGNKMVLLPVLAAAMIILGYPGETGVGGNRIVWWGLAMLPFLWILYELVVGLSGSVGRQPGEVKPLVRGAIWMTLISWSFYPIVYLFPFLKISGAGAEVGKQVGYTLADIVAKAAFGVLIYTIAVKKSAAERGTELPDGMMA